MCSFLRRDWHPWCSSQPKQDGATWSMWVLYLFGTRDEGILLESGPKGRSVLNIDNTDGEQKFEFEDGEKSLLEVVCDADYAGDERTRRSVSSVQIYLDGNLMESYVRCQKSIALSPGESEYIAMVGGVSEAMFIHHLGIFDKRRRKWFADQTHRRRDHWPSASASAGRATSQQICCGFNRRSLKSVEKLLKIRPIGTAFSPADTGTKCLSKARMKGLKYIIKMINGNDEKVGRNE